MYSRASLCCKLGLLCFPTVLTAFICLNPIYDLSLVKAFKGKGSIFGCIFTFLVCLWTANSVYFRSQCDFFSTMKYRGRAWNVLWLKWRSNLSGTLLLCVTSPCTPLVWHHASNCSNTWVIFCKEDALEFSLPLKLQQQVPSHRLWMNMWACVCVWSMRTNGKISATILVPFNTIVIIIQSFTNIISYSMAK